MLRSARYPRRGAGMTELWGAGVAELWSAGVAELLGRGWGGSWGLVVEPDYVALRDWEVD